MRQLGCMSQGKELCSWVESMCFSGGRARAQKGAHLEKTL